MVRRNKRNRKNVLSAVWGFVFLLAVFIAIYVFVPSETSVTALEIIRIVSIYGIGLVGSGLLIFIVSLFFKSTRRILKL